VDIKSEITAKVGELPPEMQQQVLRFVDSLVVRTPKGVAGSSLLSFAGSLDHTSAEEMTLAIEEACEHIDAGGW